MPKLMTMKDFLAGGSMAAKTYQRNGIVPSHVAQPNLKMKKKRMSPPPKKMGNGMNKGMKKKKK